ncbi:hypothetical protein [Peptoniphilus porci]|nr:hypothetical protein [Peptoniphilus porci]
MLKDLFITRNMDYLKTAQAVFDYINYNIDRGIFSMPMPSLVMLNRTYKETNKLMVKMLKKRGIKVETVNNTDYIVI